MNIPNMLIMDYIKLLDFFVDVILLFDEKGSF